MKPSTSRVAHAHLQARSKTSGFNVWDAVEDGCLRVTASVEQQITKVIERKLRALNTPLVGTKVALNPKGVYVEVTIEIPDDDLNPVPEVKVYLSKALGLSRGYSHISGPGEITFSWQLGPVII
ncbi:hypothetical protein N9917_00280 [Deltaproteobacteria bacterium]|nr:hypothetical protein [Deltaproteobacteria bacterium]